MARPDVDNRAHPEPPFSGGVSPSEPDGSLGEPTGKHLDEPTALPEIGDVSGNYRKGGKWSNPGHENENTGRIDRSRRYKKQKAIEKRRKHPFTS